jgi:hypothetical protein
MDSRLAEALRVVRVPDLTADDAAVLEEELTTTIQRLTITAWAQSRVRQPLIAEWLEGFIDPNDQTPRLTRIHALYLLSRFMYFGEVEIRALLKALFRDEYRYPIVCSARKTLGNTTDLLALNTIFESALRRTRFLGVGNPSESGTHLLYHYRQENQLQPDYFKDSHEIFNLLASPVRLQEPNVTRYIFLDDFCGSGTQVEDYSRDLVNAIREAAKHNAGAVTVEYHVVFATSWGAKSIRESMIFDRVVALIEIDESYRTFSNVSRYFEQAPASITKAETEYTATYFGHKLWPRFPLGYRHGQLMIGFFHNTPDNALPVFWHHGSPPGTWHPIFRRYYKL